MDDEDILQAHGESPVVLGPSEVSEGGDLGRSKCLKVSLQDTGDISSPQTQRWVMSSGALKSRTCVSASYSYLTPYSMGSRIHGCKDIALVCLVWSISPRRHLASSKFTEHLAFCLDTNNKEAD